MLPVDVIIVGAGACGLMIARKLSQAGMKVVILEARDRLGGRIHTIEDPALPGPLETGAEFIHGNLPVTTGLLKEAGIHYRKSGGARWRFTNGKFTQDDDFMEKGDELTKRLQELKQDMTIASFLETYFKDEAGVKNAVKGFVEGYDAADINRASTEALRKEWVKSDDWKQYRANGGYVQMVRFLEKECRKSNCLIYSSAIVKEIEWQPDHVEVITDEHQRYTGKKLVITVPLGVLCSESKAIANITFSPSLPDKADAMRLLGFGGVIKVLLLFKHAFWKDLILPGEKNKSLKNMGWLFSAATIPTWWTQAPDESALLTGWLAGPKAALWKDADNSKILEAALDSLRLFFSMSRETLTELLAYSDVINWPADPFSLGAYSYATPETAAAIKRISIPVEKTLFFAGEAFYDGPELGTVESALANGLKVAELVLKDR